MHIKRIQPMILSSSMNCMETSQLLAKNQMLEGSFGGFSAHGNGRWVRSAQLHCIKYVRFSLIIKETLILTSSEALHKLAIRKSASSDRGSASALSSPQTMKKEFHSPGASSGRSQISSASSVGTADKSTFGTPFFFPLFFQLRYALSSFS